MMLRVVLFVTFVGIHVENLLLKLSASGVGCYTGHNFVGASAYDDKIVLVVPTQSASHKMLAIIIEFASNMTLCLLLKSPDF